MYVHPTYFIPIRRHDEMRQNKTKWKLMMYGYSLDTQHSISNFPGPQLIVNPQNGKRTVVIIYL